MKTIKFAILVLLSQYTIKLFLLMVSDCAKSRRLGVKTSEKKKEAATLWSGIPKWHLNVSDKNVIERYILIASQKVPGPSSRFKSFNFEWGITEQHSMTKNGD